MRFWEFLFVTTISAMLWTVGSITRFKLVPTNQDTRHVTFVIADWMHVFYSIHGLKFFPLQKSSYNAFYRDIYWPLVSRLKKNESEVFYTSSLIAFHKQTIIMLDEDGRPNIEEIIKWSEIYDHEIKDWRYVSEWLEEYEIQVENKTSTLVFFCGDFPPQIKGTLNRIQENKSNNSIIVVSDEDGHQNNMIKIAPYFGCNNVILFLARECPLSMPSYIEPILNAIKKQYYNHYDFIRNIPSRAVKKMSCLQNKTINIIYREWDIDVTTFTYFLALLDNRLLHKVQIQLLSYYKRSYFLPLFDNRLLHKVQIQLLSYYKRSPFYDIVFQSAFNNKFNHVSFMYQYRTRKVRPDHVFQDSAEEDKIFLNTIGNSVYLEEFIKKRLRRDKTQYVRLEYERKQNRLPFRKTIYDEDGYINNIIKMNPKDLDSDLFIDLLLQAFVDIAC